MELREKLTTVLEICVIHNMGMTLSNIHFHLFSKINVWDIFKSHSYTNFLKCCRMWDRKRFTYFIPEQFKNSSFECLI